MLQCSAWWWVGLSYTFLILINVCGRAHRGPVCDFYVTWLQTSIETFTFFFTSFTVIRYLVCLPLWWFTDEAEGPVCETNKYLLFETASERRVEFHESKNWCKPPRGLSCCSFQGGYFNADRRCCNSSICSCPFSFLFACCDATIVITANGWSFCFYFLSLCVFLMFWFRASNTDLSSQCFY